MVQIAVVNVLSAVLLLAFGAAAWQRPRVRGARELAALMLALGWWSTFEAALNVSSGLPAKLFWTQMEYIGVVLSPPLFLRFTRAYCGSEGRLSRALLALSWPVSMATIAAIWTGPLRLLVWPVATLDASGKLIVLTRGLWFWIFSAVSYAAMLAGAASVAGLVVRTSGRPRTQALVVLAASLLPWAGNALYVGRILAIPGLDWTPIMFSFTGLLTTFATLRLGFLELVPIARGAVVDTMRDAVLVLDDQGRVVDYNPSAFRLAGIRAGEARTAFPTLAEPLARALGEGGTELQAEVDLEVEGRSRTVELRTSPLAARSGRPLGRLVVLRDITERRAAERERERLLADLKSAAAEINTLRGLLPICSSCKRIRDDQGYWSQIETYISKHADVRFSHGLCPDCARRLYPEVFDKTPPAAP